jgi:transcriptional regulator with XRE-family HTH domain
MGDLKDRLKVARERAGLSQGQVAKLLGFHRPTISQIENGDRSVKADELLRFADAYGVDVDWLAGTSASYGVDDRVMLAARELSALAPEALDKVLDLLATLKASAKENGE